MGTHGISFVQLNRSKRMVVAYWRKKMQCLNGGQTTSSACLLCYAKRNLQRPSTRSVFPKHPGIDTTWFNVSLLRAKIRTLLALVRELLYADHSAIVTDNLDGMHNLYGSAIAVSCYGLCIYVKKSAVMYIKGIINHGKVFLNSQQLQTVHNFTYLWNNFTYLMRRN